MQPIRCSLQAGLLAQGRLLAAALVAALCLAAPALLEAKAKFFTIVEKTRQADVVLLGEVTGTAAGNVIVRPTRFLKGMGPGSLSLAGPDRPHMEVPAVDLTVGDPVLAFAVQRSPGAYELFAGSQGILRLQSGWGTIYESAIGAILQLDRERDQDRQRAVLASMLSGDNRISQYAALELIYLEGEAQGWPAPRYHRQIANLVRSTDKPIALLSIQVLGRTGERIAVPVLISLLGDEDRGLAATAYRALKGMVMADIAFDPALPTEQRRVESAKLQQWWNENSARVLMVR